MGNSRVYIGWHCLILCLVVVIGIMGLLSQDPGLLFLTIPLLIPVGIVQLITGVNFLVKRRSGESSEFWGEWRVYWAISIFYFVILLLLYQFYAPAGVYYFWLWVAPWFIALYQFTIVSRIHKWRKSKRSSLIINNSKS